MSEKKMPTSRCKKAGHSEHMCALADLYFHINCPDEFRTMVKEPTFKCNFCGRAAKSDKNLCYPVTL